MKENMNSFPTPLIAEVRAAADEIRQLRKVDWMSKKRDEWFHGMAKSLADGEQAYKVTFERGRYQWATELCAELAVQHQMDVKIMIRPSHGFNSADITLPFEKWDEIAKYEQHLVFAKITHQ